MRIHLKSGVVIGREAAAKSPISTPGEKTTVDLSMAALEVEAGRPSLCEPHRACIDSKLDAGLSAQRIYQDLVSEVSFTGSYQSVKRFVRQLRDEQPNRVWRVEVQPGEGSPGAIRQDSRFPRTETSLESTILT